MAFQKILVLFVVVVIASASDHNNEVEAKNKATKTMEAEKEQSARSAYKERGRLNVLYDVLKNNRTDDLGNTSRGVKGKFNDFMQNRNPEFRKHKNGDSLMNEKAIAVNQYTTYSPIGGRDDKKPRGRKKQNGDKPNTKKNLKNTNNDNMMNDKDGAIAISQRIYPDNDNGTDALTAMKNLRRYGSLYEHVTTRNFNTQIAGVYCNFEKSNSSIDQCAWEWNTTVPRYTSPRNGGTNVTMSSNAVTGFAVMTAANVSEMNKTSKNKHSGPTTDASGDVNGHFLYHLMNGLVKNVNITSPKFPGLLEFCQFQAHLHQSMMTRGTIKLIAVYDDHQVLLEELYGNNEQMWNEMSFKIGVVKRPVRIALEITAPEPNNYRDILPHVAIDNIRLVDCFPEPPQFNGTCQSSQFMCKFFNMDACIERSQICDLVKDCDDGSDENQNCSAMPYGSYCNFEIDDCGMKNEETKPPLVLKWIRHFGSTPTEKTGPNYDHTCGPLNGNVTTMVPNEMIPAHFNYSLNRPLSSCVGWYFFANMNMTGPQNEAPSFGSVAMMKTVTFNPPPKVHGNPESKYYNSCRIRFYYQMNGNNIGALSCDFVDLDLKGNPLNTAKLLMLSSKKLGEQWFRSEHILPNTKRRYYLRFTVSKGIRPYGDVAIDDFSMSPECFGLNIDQKELGNYNYYEQLLEENTMPHRAFADKPYYRFTPCGAMGRLGPTQEMCNTTYNNSDVSVEVLGEPQTAGVQVWQVPSEGLYTIIAIGASGGKGSAWTGASHGATARILIELHKSEKIYMLVGQQGTNACKKSLSPDKSSQNCSYPSEDSSIAFHSKTREVANTEVQDGGGGGGGATFVYLVDNKGVQIPLLVAGGGGGLTVGQFKDDGSQHARNQSFPDQTGDMAPGVGGGWKPRNNPEGKVYRTAGRSLYEGGAGGLACVGQAAGGFGGGGGGCRRGGGGGGYIGGNRDELTNHARGGWSYVDSQRAARNFSLVTIAQTSSPGEVLIIPAVHDCGCNYRCVAANEFRSEVQCYCPDTWITDANDPTKCLLQDSWAQISWVVIAVLSCSVFVFALIVIFICLYLYNTYQRKKEEELRKKRLLEQEVQLQRLRNAPGDGGNPLSMAFNPHYGSESMLPQGIDVRGLPQVSRESLKLVKALGQGAFGEVYQGLYRHGTGDTREMPVAVKTLPELSTGQAESDFLMEAAIMAKFSHPNIVHLIGVCFDRHPRFIVLELLAGGDLKNFLRESRPKPERASALTMKDLLLCSLDVCKGCRYLESKRFIHRDIAARNCLLTSRGPGRVVKIADFGMARDIYRADYYKKGGKAMLPIKWMPPEAYIDGVFTTKTDVWSFGVLLWEVFSLGVMPYTGCANREVMDLVSGGGRLEKPFGCPNEIYRLMCECWNPTPTERPAFSHMFDRLQRFLQDPEIVGAALPVSHSLMMPSEHIEPNGPQRAPAACDYLVPLSPQDPASHHPSSSTGLLVHHSRLPTAPPPEMEDSPYPPLLRASQEYGNIPMAAAGGVHRSEAALAAESTTKFLTSNSTDRLLGSVDGSCYEDDTMSDDDRPVIRETSFTELKRSSVGSRKSFDNGPAVDKLISITPTSPKPPENALSKALEANVIDKTNQKNLALERTAAPLASPEPPRITAWNDQKPVLKPKPLCLDAAQLEQNLNALKKNSGSVNLNTMKIVPPYINVVTPNKLSESKPIQIDPKKAVIHDLQSPNQELEEKGKLKQSASAASLLNGPMTEVPYADSDNASSSSSSNTQNLINNKKSKNYDMVKIEKGGKISKQGSNGAAESEISC